MPDAQPVASSATEPVPLSPADQAVASRDVSAFRAARFAEKTAKPVVSSPAASTPAEPVEQVASTDASSSPASESGTPKKNNADTRVQELLRERHEQRERVDRLEREVLALRQPPPDATPAASSPATAVQSYDAWLKATPAAATSEDPYRDYLLDVAKQSRDADQRESQRTIEVQTRAAGFRQQLDAAFTADPQFWTKVSPAVSALRPIDALAPGEPVTSLNVIAQEIVESPAADRLLLHFSAHPDALTSLSQQSDRAIARAIGALVATWTTPAPTPPVALTQAPEPATTLGRRAADPADELTAAVASGDMTRYRALRLQQRTANLR